MHLTRAPSVPHRLDAAAQECLWCGCTATLIALCQRPFCAAAPEAEGIAEQDRRINRARLVPPWER